MLALNRREAGNHGEEDGQEFAAPAPVAVAEEEHGDETDQPVETGGYSQSRGIVGRRVDQLEPGEGKEQHEGRPETEPWRQARGPGFILTKAEDQSSDAPRPIPWVEPGPKITEHPLQQREAGPQQRPDHQW